MQPLTLHSARAAAAQRGAGRAPRSARCAASAPPPPAPPPAPRGAAATPAALTRRQGAAALAASLALSAAAGVVPRAALAADGAAGAADPLAVPVPQSPVTQKARHAACARARARAPPRPVHARAPAPRGAPARRGARTRDDVASCDPTQTTAARASHASLSLVCAPQVFFDVTIGSEPAGRIVLGLFGEAVPKTAANFAALGAATAAAMWDIAHATTTQR
jgi:hypothetical protein